MYGTVDVLCISFYTHTHTHTHRHTHAHMHTHMHAHGCTHTHAHLLIYRMFCIRCVKLRDDITIYQYSSHSCINTYQITMKVCRNIHDCT